MQLHRTHAYVALLLLTYFNPLTLLILGTSWTFLLATIMTLLVWIGVKWEKITSSELRGNFLETLLGVALILGNFGRNFLGLFGGGSFGLVDMLVVFAGVSIIFYGIRGFKMLSLPALYFVIMIVAYRAEFAIQEVRTLEYALAGLMANFLGGFGIQAQVIDNIVRLSTPHGVYNLQIDGPCTGIKGMLAYGSLASLMLVDMGGTRNRKLLVVAIGFLGTFVVNLVRLGAIFLTIYAAGLETGLAVHTFLGYGLFLSWVIIFWTIALPYIRPQIGPVSAAITGKLR